jgi:hypothetical protein
MAFTKLVDMELDDEDKMDMAVPAIPDKPDYPWGLKICLTHRELARLGLQADCEVGDYLDMRCFGRVTSVSTDDNEYSGQNCRVEIQIEKIAVESEDDEND